MSEMHWRDLKETDFSVLKTLADQWGTYIRDMTAQAEIITFVGGVDQDGSLRLVDATDGDQPIVSETQLQLSWGAVIGVRADPPGGGGVELALERVFPDRTSHQPWSFTQARRPL